MKTDRRKYFYFTSQCWFSQAVVETWYAQWLVGSDSWMPDGNHWEVYGSFPWLRILLWEWSQLSDYLIRPGVRSEATVCSAVSKHSCSLCLFVPIRGLTDCIPVIRSPAHLASMLSASNIVWKRWESMHEKFLTWCSCMSLFYFFLIGRCRCFLICPGFLSTQNWVRYIFFVYIFLNLFADKIIYEGKPLWFKHL